MIQSREEGGLHGIMQRMQFYKNTTCICGHCGEIFDYEESRSSPKTRKLYNIEIKETVCPKCGNSGFTKASMQKWFDKYLFT